jgi:hypothetical protein
MNATTKLRGNTQCSTTMNIKASAFDEIRTSLKVPSMLDNHELEGKKQSTIMQMFRFKQQLKNLKSKELNERIEVGLKK